MSEQPRDPTIGNAPAERSGKALAMGGLLGAIAASSCCVLPLVLFSLGAGGAWIGYLTALSPYQPAILVVTAGFLGAGFLRVYRKPKAVSCEADSFCASPKSDRLTRSALWISTLLVIGAIAFNFLAPLLLEA